MLISMKNVTRFYPLGKTTVKALRGVSLDVREGEFTVIVGPSGSGKTTLLNIMGLLDLATDGKVFFEDKDVSLIRDSDATKIRRNRIGFIFQSFNLIPVLTAIENVEIPLILKGIKGARKESLSRSIMEAVGLSDVVHHKPDQLSGGERQRVAIARALVGDPDIILADEPTANLDTETSFQIVELIGKLNKQKGITFVFSTHDERIVKLAKRRLSLVDGKIEYDSLKNSGS
ncbi:MAG: ABC transporter ATP-binding protein [Candidatus Cloacimonas sp. 4484_209]|nr:MAG: ABC transporter ATP-binding protein [Candidatus Cloacimonas sp. 4484_209]